MCPEHPSEKQSAAWLAAAVAAPLAQTASGCTWLAAGPVALACMLLAWGARRCPGEDSRWLSMAQGLWNCVVLASLLPWSSLCWPGLEGTWAIPWVLLALAAWACGSDGRAVRSGCVLLWPVALLLGAVLLSGVGDLQWEHLAPTWQMPDAWLIPVALLPALGRGGSPGRKFWWGMAGYVLAVAVVTAGVLSPEGSAQAASPIYALSRSIRLLGIAARFESLVAVAMTCGYFVTAAYLLTNGGRGTQKGWTWGGAALTAVLLLAGVRLDSRLAAVGSALLWALLPALVRWWKKKSKKLEKRG